MVAINKSLNESIDKSLGGKQRTYRQQSARLAYVILTPMIIYFFIFVWVPVFFLLALSLSEWNVISWPPTFVGFDNFRRIIEDSYYHTVIRNTLLVGTSVMIINLTLGFLVALILNRKIIGRGVFRTIWYIPAILSGAVMAEVMNVFLLPTDLGLFNMIRQSLGASGPMYWKFDPMWMSIWMIVFTVWRTIGWVIIFFLSGLQSLDPVLEEAAKIDGARGWQILLYITVPQLRPIILFVSITGLIGGLQVWEFPLIISNGGPLNATNTLVFSMYRDAFGNLDMGMGASQAFLLLLFLTGAIGIQIRYYRKRFS